MNLLFIIWIGCVVGITHIIVATAIFAKLRNYMDRISPNFFGILFSCPTCMGFWVGVVVSTFFAIIQTYEINGLFINNEGIIKNALVLLLHGALSSFFCWITNLFTTYMENISLTVELKNEAIAENPLEVAKQILLEQS